jgi:transcriptional regulator with XRE-family HTH domain
VDTENGSPPDPDQLPVRHVTINQVIARNITHWRKAADITQDELGRRLGRSKRNVSADERSWDGERTREFNGAELADLAAAFGVPVGAFFMPPEDDGVTVRYMFTVTDPDQPGDRDMADLAGMMLPDSDDDTPVMAAYRERLRLMVRKYKPPPWHEDVDYWLTDLTGTEIREEKVAILREHQRNVQAAATFLGQLREAAGEEEGS